MTPIEDYISGDAMRDEPEPELPVCEWCNEERDDTNDMAGPTLCSDCFSDGGYA
jgi:hypothetical protein